MSEPQNDLAAQLGSAPALFLDQFEELRMSLSNEQLIAEATEINHAGIGKHKTLERYRDHLVHYSQYLASVHGETFYSARKKHVRLFMGHLEKVCVLPQELSVGHQIPSTNISSPSSLPVQEAAW